MGEIQSIDPPNASTDPKPSIQSVTGLNWLLFFISDIRHGIGPLLSIHLRNSLLWNPAKVGIALAAVEFSAFLCQIPAGLAADASKRKRLILAFCSALIIFGCGIYLSFSAFSWIIFAQILMGISVAFISPMLGSITLGLFGRKQFPPRVGKNEVWNHFGNVFSCIIAGLMGFWFGTHWIFFVIIFFGFGSLLSLSFIKPKEIHYEIARELPSNSQVPLPISKVLNRSPVIIFNIALIIYYMSNGAQLTLVSQILATIVPTDSTLFISSCMLIAEVMMIIVSFIMIRVVNRFNRKTLFLIAFTILPIRALLYTVVDNPYSFLFIQTLDGVAAGILGTMGAVINSDLAVNTGRFNLLQSIGAMSNCIGESISQLFAGFIAAYFGFSFSFISLAITAVIGILFFAFFMPETSKTK